MATREGVWEPSAVCWRSYIESPSRFALLGTPERQSLCESHRQRRWRSCPCRLRLNATGSPIDHYRTKKVYIRGLSWPHDGSLNRGDALEVSRVDARRLLRPPPRAAFHPHGVLTPPRAGATAGRGRAAPHGPCHHNTFLSITATIALSAEGG